MLGDDPAHFLANGGSGVQGGDTVCAGIRTHRLPVNDPGGQHEASLRAEGELSQARC